MHHSTSIRLMCSAASGLKHSETKPVAYTLWQNWSDILNVYRLGKIKIVYGFQAHLHLIY